MEKAHEKDGFALGRGRGVFYHSQAIGKESLVVS